MGFTCESKIVYRYIYVSIYYYNNASEIHCAVFIQLRVISKNHSDPMGSVDSNVDSSSEHEDEEAPIIDELLCFIVNKFHTMNPEEIALLCTRCFKDEEIGKSYAISVLRKGWICKDTREELVPIKVNEI